MSNQSHNIAEIIEKQDNNAVNRLIIGMTALAIIGVPLSISRSVTTGWLTSYTFQIIGTCIMLLLLTFHRKLSIRFKAMTVMAVAFFVTIFDLYIFGLYGNGMLWAGFTLIILFNYCERTLTFFVSFLLFAIFTYSMYGFTVNGKLFPGDVYEFHTAFRSWGTAFFGSAMFVVLIAFIVRSQKEKTKQLILVLEQQNFEIKRIANHDTLTGLPTLRLANERLDLTLEISKRRGEKIAVIFIDLDGFKKVNDSFGHDAGDYLLKNMAERFLSVIRKSDTACRIGGDEFIIIISDFQSREYVGEISKRLLDIVKKPVMFNNQNLQVRASIGISLFPDHASTAEELKKIADEAMYKVKKSGKDNYLFANSGDISDSKSVNDL